MKRRLSIPMRRYDGVVKGSQSRFFIDADFDAFDPKYATSNDPKIIAARKFVVENRMRYLKNDQDSGQGLVDFFRKYDIHPHWRKQNLTNIFWPLPVANRSYIW
jgi:hypothetical protein